MPELEPRIERMHRRDRHIAIVLVAILIVTVGTVYGAISPLAGTPAVRWALGIAGILLVLFNAASIGAMLRHNREDKDAIYSLDLRHLDEYRQRRAARKAGSRADP